MIRSIRIIAVLLFLLTACIAWLVDRVIVLQARLDAVDGCAPEAERIATITKALSAVPPELRAPVLEYFKNAKQRGECL